VQRLRAEIARLSPQALILESSHRPTLWINSHGETAPLHTRFTNCVGFCGIGNPDAFRTTLSRIGVNITSFRVYPDHYNYTRTDVEELHGWVRRHDCQAVVTTQKDLVKLQMNRLGQRELWALRIDLHVTSGAERFQDLLRRTLGNTGAVLKAELVPVGRPVALD
jgi:tetraacyldisaccharide 4'-kinase